MTPEEFTARFLPLGEGLYRIGLSLLESQEEARDAVQDVFLKMWASRDRLDAVRDPRAWSYVLMRNLCVDRVRTREKLRKEPLPAGLAADPPDEPPEKLARALAAVKSLPDKDRQLLRMRLNQDLSYEEIAQLTGQSELALRVAFHRIKNKIRKKI